MNNPYEILGVSQNASDEEIKKAYRELVKKYHPDNYANNPLADLADEKMKEINEAYDTIQKQRESGYAYAYQSSDTSSGDSTSYGGSGQYNAVRQLINQGRFDEAEMILKQTAPAGRNAEWNFLMGCVLMRRGRFFDAQRYVETACDMDPGNAEYRMAREQMRSQAAAYGNGYRTDMRTGDCTPCDACSSLLCADCLCECLGGDLVRCC